MTTENTPAIRWLDTLSGAIQFNEPAAAVHPDAHSRFVKVEAIYHDTTSGVAAEFFDGDPALLGSSWWLLRLNNLPTWILEQTTPAPTIDGEKRAYGFVHNNELPAFKTLDEAVNAIARAAFYWEFYANLGYEQPKTWTPSPDYRTFLVSPPF
jgi:hypothetical protein